MDKKLVQQGDVLMFSTTENIPGNAHRKDVKNGLLTIAEGEATGHHHSIVAEPEIELYEDDNGTLWLKCEKEATVTHQEHKPVTLEPGTYRVGIVQEVDPFADEVRKVID